MGPQTESCIQKFGAVQLMTRFKPNGRLAPIFEKVKEHDPKSLYSKNELKEIFKNWLMRQPELRVPEDRSVVRVTPLIYRVLLKPKKEKNKMEGWKNHASMVKVVDVYNRFDRECQKYTAIVLPDVEPKFLFGPVAKITYKREKRQGGKKHVTHITGLEHYGLDPKEFASACSKKFACATTARTSLEKTRRTRKK